MNEVSLLVSNSRTLMPLPLVYILIVLTVEFGVSSGKVAQVLQMQNVSDWWCVLPPFPITLRQSYEVLLLSMDLFGDDSAVNLWFPHTKFDANQVGFLRFWLCL